MNKGFNGNRDFRVIKISMLNQACEAKIFRKHRRQGKNPCGKPLRIFTLAAYKAGWYSAESKPT